MVDDDLSTDEVYRLLSAQTRRETIKYFSQNSSISYSSRDDVAGHLDDTMEESLEDLRKRLHHVDLPKLEEADFLLYEPEEGRITYLGDDRLEENVDAIE